MKIPSTYLIDHFFNAYSVIQVGVIVVFIIVAVFLSRATDEELGVARESVAQSYLSSSLDKPGQVYINHDPVDTNIFPPDNIIQFREKPSGPANKVTFIEEDFPPRSSIQLETGKVYDISFSIGGANYGQYDRDTTWAYIQLKDGTGKSLASAITRHPANPPSINNTLVSDIHSNGCLLDTRGVTDEGLLLEFHSFSNGTVYYDMRNFKVSITEIR
jgi:hypothetical protein